MLVEQEQAEPTEVTMPRPMELTVAMVQLVAVVLVLPLSGPLVAMALLPVLAVEEGLLQLPQTEAMEATVLRGQI